MSEAVRLLVVANRSIDLEEVRDAIVERAAAGPVHVTLVAPALVGGGPPGARDDLAARRVDRARHAATVERLERTAQLLRDAGLEVHGVLGGHEDPFVAAEDVWDPGRFDEVVVSCRPWLSFRRASAEPGWTLGAS